MASSYLTKNLSTATDLKTWTWSAWIKRSKLSTEQGLFSGDAASTYTTSFFFDTSDRLQYKDVSAGSTRQQLITNRVFRDTSAWYNIQVVYNSTEGTASNRLKFYVNGSQETSFSTATYPSSNETTQINSSDPTGIGKQPQSTSNNFDGVMTHIHFIDGTAYDADTFGETDATTGIWKPKTAPSVTYGTNGFFIKAENSGALGTDSSGEGNDFVVNGTPTQIIDTPSNVFATLNPLVRYTVNPTFTNGNLSFTGGSASGFAGALGTLAMTQGKWFWECKISATLTNTLVGVQQVGLNLNTSEPQNITGGTTCFYNNDGGEMKTDGTATTADYGTFSATDIMGVAVNMDDKQISIYKNGSAIISNFALSASSTEVLPFFAMYYSGAIANFGNGYFGTTAVASATTDESGLGIFEYDVPTGYYALCTKNINEQEYS